nr:uncharacterized protein LOC128697157 [Cherax quadricarinatus]
MCRWMFLSPQSTIVSEVPSERVGDLHVITVPMGGIQGPPCVQGPLCAPGAATTTQGKPPDYFLVVEKPPSYEEAMSMLLPYAATSSSSWHLSASGLEDFLAPNQVPGSQVDGTTSASPHNCQGGSECLPEVLLPPAYSSRCHQVPLHPWAMATLVCHWKTSPAARSPPKPRLAAMPRNPIHPLPLLNHQWK